MQTLLRRTFAVLLVFSVCWKTHAEEPLPLPLPALELPVADPALLPALATPDHPDLFPDQSSLPIPHLGRMASREAGIPPSPSFDHHDIRANELQNGIPSRFVSQYGASSQDIAQQSYPYPTYPEQQVQLAAQGTYWIVSSRNSVQSIHQSERGRWGLDVYQRLPDGRLVQGCIQSLVAQLNPNLPVCIFAHGSFVEWNCHVHQSHAFYNRIAPSCGGQLQMIFFTWLSDGARTNVLPIDVAVRGRRADFNSLHLSGLIAAIPESCPITFIGHSHGTRLVLATMHLIGGGTVEGYYYPYAAGRNRRFRAVLAAGAFEHDWLNPGQPYACALRRLESLLNLQNRRDAALALFPLSRPFSARAVARSGFTNRDYRHLGEQSAKIQEVDVSEYVGMHHYWPNYYEQPIVTRAILPYLFY